MLSGVVLMLAKLAPFLLQLDYSVDTELSEATQERHFVDNLEIEIWRFYITSDKKRC